MNDLELVLTAFIFKSIVAPLPRNVRPEGGISCLIFVIRSVIRKKRGPN
jgi:hypothetical protein